MTPAGENFLGVRGGNPPLIQKIYTPPLERKLHPPLRFLTLSTCGYNVSRGAVKCHIIQLSIISWTNVSRYINLTTDT